MFLACGSDHRCGRWDWSGSVLFPAFVQFEFKFEFEFDDSESERDDDYVGWHGLGSRFLIYTLL